MGYVRYIRPVASHSAIQRLVRRRVQPSKEKSMSEAVAQAQPGATPRVPMSRREFLYYLWAVSMALFLAEAGGALIGFALPRFREGEFGGVFSIPTSELPQPDADPQEFPAGRFWLVRLGPASVTDPAQPHDSP